MAKYVSVNELSTFVFHDAILDELALDGRDMVWHLDYLGVCLENSQNNHSDGRMIKRAKVTLHDFVFVPFYHPNTGKIPAVTISELARYANDSGTEFIFNCFFEAPSDEPGIFCGDATLMHTRLVKDYETGLLSFSVKFSRLTVEWDEFDGPGWWEKRP